jgi:hypothetical protein
MKSITIIGKPVEYVYLIKDINIDKIMLDKYATECRNNIVSTWESVEEQANPDQSQDNRKLEIILKDKISTATFYARGNIIEMMAKMGGMIIKDISVEKGKGRSQKVYLIGIDTFKETI